MSLPILQRIARAVLKGLRVDLDHGGWISTTSPWNFWQTHQGARGGRNEVVYACVQAYARTIAQLPGHHIRTADDGFDETLKGTPLQRVMRKPNSYQTRSDFLLNLVSSLLYEGNAYILAGRDARFEITSLHLVPPHACSPYVADGQVFYHVSPDQITGMGGGMLVPARDVGHVRLHTPTDPLRGETPLYAASLAISINNNIAGHQSKFFENMSRPSGVLETDHQLNAEQTAALRQRWDEQSQGLNSGGVPILGWGIKWKPLSLNSVDAQLIDAFKLSVERIAAAYGVPLPIVGVLDGATYNNVHNLLSFWKANGLGFVIEHIEQTITALFDLPDGERLELDTNRLMRLDELTEMDALTKGVTGGVLAPNEARKRKGLKPVDGGDMPRVQQQMVPLDYEPPEPTPAPEPQPEPEADEDEMRQAIESAA
jgi:HK97 family phage portal protein